MMKALPVLLGLIALAVAPRVFLAQELPDNAHLFFK